MMPTTPCLSSVSQRRARLGVSLLEVLFSIAILTVGLLGVASVIPLGGREMAEAGKADRMTACAQAILRDVKVRSFLNPRGWRYQDGSNVVVNISGQNWLRCRTYAIDPMFIAYANSQGITDADRYPYGSAATEMARVTLARSLTSTVVLSTSEAERLCTWNDDLLFPMSDEPEDRPRAFVLADMGSNTTDFIRWPVRSSDGVVGSPLALLADKESNFTWALTVTPIGAITRISGNDYVNIDQPLAYQVSVVVFFNRNLGAISDIGAAERGERPISTIRFLGGGLGGGDVELTNALTEELKEKSWLMVPYGPPPPPGTARPYEWYSVVAADDLDLTAATRYATIDGRDWPFGYDTNAAWFPDVIGVFTTTIASETRD